MSKWDPDPDEIRDTRPYDYAGAKRAIARASHDQRSAENTIKDAARDLAEKERAYRKALAVEITTLRAGGSAATTAADLARGDEKVANLRYSRDVAEGVYEAAKQAVWRHTGDRRELEKLIDWSMRVAPDGQEDEPAEPQPVIGRAA